MHGNEEWQLSLMYAWCMARQCLLIISQFGCNLKGGVEGVKKRQEERGPLDLKLFGCMMRSVEG